VYTKKERTIPDLKPGQLRIEFTTSESLVKSGAGYIKVKVPIGSGEEKKYQEEEIDVAKSKTVVMTMDEASFKTIDKKELLFRLKKKKFLFMGGGLLDEKKFRLTELGTKCDMAKDVKASGNATYSLKFSIHTPIRGKDYEEVKS
jgi:hypothetical protein